MAFDIVTVNDAIQRTFNNPSMFDWWGIVSGYSQPGLNAVKRINNPVLRKFKGNQAITWKDWALILGGGGHVLNTLLKRMIIGSLMERQYMV